MIFRLTILYGRFTDGLFESIWGKAMDKMVIKVRLDAGRAPDPGYGLIDSQIAKTTNKNENRGFDGGKRSRDTKGIS